MIWLTWRQFRAQAVTAAAALAAFAILLAATGPHLASLYAASGLSGCHPASCADQASGWLTQLDAAHTYFMLYEASVAVILLAPAVIGMFWGAPLIAGELETGTAALAWNQSVTRTRWLAAKLAVGGLTAMAVTEGLSLMQAWWAAPIGRAVGLGATSTFFAMSRFNSLAFASHGITPLGYAAFGYAAFGYAAFGYAAFGYAAFGYAAFGYAAFGYAAFGYAAFGYAAFGYAAFGYAAFGYAAFGYAAFGYAAFGYAAFGYAAFGYAAFGYAAFGYAAFGYAAFGYAAFGYAAFGYAAFGYAAFGYAAFGYALGVTAGALIRRAVPAMAVTLAIFAAAQIAMPLWIRPNLLPAEHAVVSVTSLRTITLQGGGPHSSQFHLGTENLPGQPGAWILSAGTVNAAGQATTTAPAPCTTRQSEESTHAFIECLASQGIRESVAYQPASRYWAIQWTETANYLAVALALSGYCFWRLSRRLT